MPDCLLELASEEIPPRMQTLGAKLLEEGLHATLDGVPHSSLRVFATPRRLAAHITGLPTKKETAPIAVRGPRTDAPDKAIDGFLRKHNATRKVLKAEGAHYVLHKAAHTEAMRGALARILPPVLQDFNWPVSMRWGAKNHNGAHFNWIRPLRSILCLFGKDIVPFSVGGIESGRITHGHPVLAPDAITIRTPADYAPALEKAFVCLDAETRKSRIMDELQKLARARKIELVMDDALLGEVAGQCQWPSVLLGKIDARFMELPREVITCVMRTHQYYFAFTDKATGELAPYFACVIDSKPADKGKSVIAGHESVLRARLDDADFYIRRDLKIPLKDRVKNGLDKIMFHPQLGTMKQKAERMGVISPNFCKTGVLLYTADTHKTLPVTEKDATDAAWLAKADLATEIVREFPELQGVMGRYYALKQGIKPEIANAIGEHHAPRGPSDSIPKTDLGKAVALSDKLDTLVGFSAIGEQPTGAGDPFALRRAALGIIRILLEGEKYKIVLDYLINFIHAFSGDISNKSPEETKEAVDSFLADRLKVYLRNKGARYDLVDAVFTFEGDKDPWSLNHDVEELSKFLDGKDGAHLLAGYRRAINILRIEEKKDDCVYEGIPKENLYDEESERSLYRAIAQMQGSSIKIALESKNFGVALTGLSKLREPVDDFFENVRVNDPDPAIRRNRLLLLSQIRATMHKVADFSKIVDTKDKGGKGREARS